MSDNPKRHHFIPQFVIERWHDNDDMLYYFSKNSRKKIIERRTAKGVFWRRHLYSGYSGTGRRDPQLEKAYRAPETVWAEMTTEIVDTVRKGFRPQLNSIQRSNIQNLIFHQYKRVPAILDHLDGEEEVRAAILDHADKEPDRRQEILKLLEPENLTPLTKNATLMAISKNSERVMAEFSKKNLVFGRITDPRASFVLGSVPIGRFGRSGSSFSHATAEMSFPISPDIVVGFSGNGGKTAVVDVADRNLIRSYNESMVARSTGVVSNNLKLLQSLVRRIRSQDDP